MRFEVFIAVKKVISDSGIWLPIFQRYISLPFSDLYPEVEPISSCKTLVTSYQTTM
jgi:hypothetical protein